MGDVTHIYAVADDSSTHGFILVGSKIEIDLNGRKKGPFSVYQLIAEKNKPTNFSLGTKAINVAKDKII
jgi:hypothetical protein